MRQNSKLNQIEFLDSEIQMPLMKLPVRSTFVKLKSAGILISPGSQLSHDQLMQLHGVTDIVGSNLLHCKGLKKAAEAFPGAKIWAPQGALVFNKISGVKELSLTNWPYQDELSIIETQGLPKVNEFVFIHKHSQTLILTDLAFNLLNAKGIGAWIILNIFGTYRKFAVSKLLTKFLEDKVAFQKSAQEILNHQFENIVVSHGDAIVGNAKEKFRRALAVRGFEVL